MKDTTPYLYYLASDEGGSPRDVYFNIEAAAGQRYLAVTDDREMAQLGAQWASTERRKYRVVRTTWEALKSHPTSRIFAGIHVGPPDTFQRKNVKAFTE